MWLLLFWCSALKAHSGGTDPYGCHSGSQPYHCHDEVDEVGFFLPLEADSLVADSIRQLHSLTVEPENRCSYYDQSDYRHPQSLELRIALRDGMVSRYTGYWFSSLKESQIEHVVAKSEAHDSGLCGASFSRRRQFARDLDNLVLALPGVNLAKSAKDAADWLPRLGRRCWFVRTVIRVKAKYGLSVDAREKAALGSVLERCGASSILQ